jgi:hypothetical protein
MRRGVEPKQSVGCAFLSTGRSNRHRWEGRVEPNSELPVLTIIPARRRAETGSFSPFSSLPGRHAGAGSFRVACLLPVEGEKPGATFAFPGQPEGAAGKRASRFHVGGRQQGWCLKITRPELRFKIPLNDTPIHPRLYPMPLCFKINNC